MTILQLLPLLLETRGPLLLLQRSRAGGSTTTTATSRGRDI